MYAYLVVVLLEDGIQKVDHLELHAGHGIAALDTVRSHLLNHTVHWCSLPESLFWCRTSHCHTGQGNDHHTCNDFERSHFVETKMNERFILRMSC